MPPVPAGPVPQSPSSIPQDPLYDSLAVPVLMETQALRLDSIILFRGSQEIAFHQGYLRLFTPVGGKNHGGVFRGAGALTLTPPAGTELAEVEYRLQRKPVNGAVVVPFRKAVLWFEPSLLGDLGSNLPVLAVPADDDDREDLSESVKFATDKWNSNAAYSLANEARHLTPQPFLFCELFLDKGRKLFFTFDRRRFEEITIAEPVKDHLDNEGKGTRYIDVPEHTLSLISSFHATEEYLEHSEYELTAEDKRPFDFLDCNVQLTLRKSGQTNGTAALRVRSLDGSAYLPFLLDPSLMVDSVVSASGSRLPVHRPDESWEGRVLMPAQDSTTFEVVFHYSGEFFKSTRGEGFVLWNNSGNLNEPESSTGWYPQSTFPDRMSFDVRYRYPADLMLVAAGRMVSDTTDGEEKISRYRLPHPDINCSFSAGRYKVLEHRQSNDEPPITLYHTGVAEPELMIKNLGAAFSLYTLLFGKSSYEALKAVSVPTTHGEAHLEFVKLPSYDEFAGEGGTSTALGKAHEVAHTWWGYDVGWRSYHDVWLSEGISTYASVLYAGFVLKNDEYLFTLLDDWKKFIVREWKLPNDKDEPVAPIWLGHRVSSSRSSLEYSLSIYKKGAWVMHMLRMMMLDLPTMKEDAYKAMIQEFFAAFKGKDASTEDLIAISTKYFGMDMTWFFDQWLRRSEVPTLTWGQKVKQTPEGKYSLEITVDQSDVADPFTLLVPFEITFADGTTARARLRVDKFQNSFTYELAQEPDDVKMNIMQSVLCRLEEN